MQLFRKLKIATSFCALILLVSNSVISFAERPTSSYNLALTPTANAGVDQSVCGLSMTLNGNNPAPATGTWTIVSGPGTANFSNIHLRNSGVTVSTAGTYTFQWSISDINGTTTDQVSITFYSAATTANAGPDQIVCGNTADLAANSPANGFGIWVFVSGPGAISFSNPSSPTSSITVSADGTYTLQWTIFNGVCPLSTDLVDITFNSIDVTPNAGPDAIMCGLTFTLNGNDPTPSTSAWSVVSGPGTAILSSPSTTSTDVSVSIQGDYTFQYTITNPVCPPTSDLVTISFQYTTEVCDGVDNDCDNLIDEGFDVDADGYTTCSGDCDDTNPLINPGMPELCNGIDDNCNGQIDEGVQTTFYVDSDGDSYGNPAISILACSAPTGFVTDNTDCNDANSSIHPNATEVCNNIDDDCNTLIDDGLIFLDYYQDADGDSFGNPAISVNACEQPIGFVLDNTDCDDNDAAVNPAATEVCNLIDDNCNGLIDEGVQTTFYEDADGDSFGNPAVTLDACTAPTGYVLDNTDCDDTNPAVNPAATEICNLIDDNCNGQIDEGVQTTFYEDADGDLYGNPNVSIDACTAPTGYVLDNTDCDDTDPAINPGASEICNLIDDNCNTLIDEGVQTTFYQDADSDGYGNPAVSVLACTAPTGYVLDNTDCDDTNPLVNIGATEICNLIDDNCNGQIDEGVQTTFYQDADGDNFGNPAVSIDACTAPTGYVLDNTDCNDSDPAIYPGAAEVCNNLDDDCNGLIDDGLTFLDYYLDADGDTFGNPAVSVNACAQPTFYVLDNTDCDDSNPAVNPAATEVCNLIDDNCNGLIDEGVQTTFYQDADGDTYGNPTVTIDACTAPTGYVADNTDCNDADASIHPNATEVCNNVDDDCNTLIDDGLTFLDYYQDADGDTYGNAAVSINACQQPTGYVLDNTDCDDTNAAVNPGATEVCNLIDDNCNGQIDEGVQTTFYQDADGDNFGNPAVSILACTAPTGYVLDNTDCDDSNAAINPAATEVCNNIDDNCNGQIDEGTLITYYEDADGDTYGNPAVSVQACTAPAGYVLDNTDCDDTNAAINPGATEICNLIDDNCNTLIDEGVQTTFYQDADGDSFGNPAVSVQACTAPTGYVLDNTDCDDTNPLVNIAAIEICNLIDDNCNGQIDEGVQTTFYQDADGDTFGNPSVSLQACSAPTGYVLDNTDCNDANPTIYPGAAESCNNIDDDCNGLIDDGLTFLTYFQDNDADTYGNPAVSLSACSQPSGYVLDNTDCNDANAAIHPGATEICNSIDDNCNTQIDEGLTFLTYYQDSDGDTYGNPAVSLSACAPPTGYVLDNTDCNDANNAVHPGATEICNNIDDNCNGQIDEGVQNTYYQDADGDTYGNVAVTILACTPPTGYVSNSTDCNDANAAVHPGATEICNNIDDNCNGQIDEGVLITFYQDADADGYGNIAVTTQACTPPAGYVANSTDCNDANPAIHPGATEVCNNIDDNCNGQIDEGTLITYYQDADGDSFGNPAVSTQACAQPTGYVLNNTDCNDANAAVNPSATEVCNLIDDNCNTLIDEGVQTTYYQDADADTYGNPAVSTLACTQPTGYVLNNTDCNDANAAVNPVATEVCNLIDDNCNTLIDEGVQTTFYFDADGDGFGNPLASLVGCFPPPGYGIDNTDCNDANPAIYPGASEICNSIDDNCNTQIDEGLTFLTYYQDNDGDTYGNPAVSVSACAPLAGYVLNNTDCNDNSAAINPAATEVCNNIDDNCNTQIDEGVQNTYYQDADSDTFGNPAVTQLACTQPTGYVSNNTDCNDADALINPNTIWYLDSDGDSYYVSTLTQCNNPGVGYTLAVGIAGDCDDTNPAINAGATEVCNNIDDNCNGQIDEGVQTTFYQDADGDNFGNPAVSALACSAPAGYVLDNTDCDDANAAVNSAAIEVCNNIDDNCNGQIDEGVTTTYYADTDADGYGDPNNTTQACSQPVGYVTDNTDCDDTNPAVNVSAVEICNNIDDNCDGQIDEGVTLIFFADVDGDGFGDVNNTTNACTPPTGYVVDNTDCNDSNASINPVAQEVCNSIDDNCNGAIDEGLVFNTYYIDTDADGFGNIAIDSISCVAPVGYVIDNTDCDDNNAAVNSAAVEVCNNIDDNCNGQIDEGLSAGECADTDNDGLNNFNDLDDDNDGITDVTEAATAQNNGDTDGDGILDKEDLDSDGDGIFDIMEVLGNDPDNDGMVGVGAITDVNADGLEDSLEPNGYAPVDFDGDGLPNFQDVDSDADTVPDAVEFDMNNDGIAPDDTDNDGNWNFLDIDDDGDGLTTAVEWDYNQDGVGPDDCDYDGIPNFLDADQCQLFIPEGFSPNNDGANDTFVIENKNPGSAVGIEIFNRWGSKVYQSDNYQNDWGGDDLPVGTYYYVIKFSDGTETKAGYLTLWR